MTPEDSAGKAAESPDTGAWQLRLYVAGQTANCLKAFANLKRICEENLAGRYQIEVVDLVENPRLAAGDEIIAIPTLVRKLPTPVRKIIGDLSNTERVLVGLQLRPQPGEGRDEDRLATRRTLDEGSDRNTGEPGGLPKAAGDRK